MAASQTYTRREFSLALAAAGGSHTVEIGVQSYSLRDRPLEAAVAAMAELKLLRCELAQPHVEPAGLTREELRTWRLTVPLRHFHSIRELFDKAGVSIFALNYSFREDYTDEEIRRGFEFAAALGTRHITASANTSTVRRIDPHAKRARIRIGLHNHSTITPDEFATPGDFKQALREGSEWIGVNLDIGHFTAAGFDSVSFIQENPARITNLHLKDRKRNQGPNVPWGEGDTPIREVLRLLQQRRFAIPAMIEYEYKGADAYTEVRRCAEFCQKAMSPV